MFFRKNHLAPPTILLRVALPEATSGGQCTPTKQDVDLRGASVQELGGRQAPKLRQKGTRRHPDLLLLQGTI